MSTTSILFFLLSAALAAPLAAHNITLLLADNPDYSTFNSLLSQTNLADDINRRATVTVLAVSNSVASFVSHLPLEIQRRVLSVHVILDYLDVPKLHAIENRSAILTTLFQTTGIAANNTGFLNVTKFDDGRIAFGPAAVGATLSSDLVGAVVARPYNISVLQISSVIIPPGIDGLGHPTPPPSPSPSPPQNSSIVVVPAPGPGPASAQAKEPISPSKSPAPTFGITPAPAKAPTTGSSADSPAADLPGNGSGADVPDGAVDGDNSPATRWSTAGVGQLGLMVAIFVAFL